VCAAAIGYRSPLLIIYPHGVQFLRAVHAESMLLRPTLMRTQLGFLLLLLGMALVWLRTRGVDSLTLTLHAAALSAVLCAAFLAGREAERAALPLTHPSTPLAIATGRWLTIVVPSALLTVACAAATGASAATAAAGLTAVCAVAGCALPAVLAAGNSAAFVLFLLMAIAGAVPPERLVDLAHPGALRLAAASVLELGPALWHYREIALGQPSGVWHAIAWAGLGIMLASAAIARRR
jgi:hypothetical protein